LIKHPVDIVLKLLALETKKSSFIPQNLFDIKEIIKIKILLA